MVGIKDFDMPSCCNSCSHWSFNRDDEPLCDLTYEYIRQFDKRQDDCPLVEAIPKADYEARLRADMVAMLEELDLTIDEIPIVTRHGITGTVMTAQGMRKKIKENIQQKINSLKEVRQQDEKIDTSKSDQGKVY